MIHLFITILVVALPVVVLFSGMAMTPLLLVFLLLILLGTPKAALRHPKLFLPNYRTLLGLLAMFLTLPLVTSLWSITPDVSTTTSLLSIMVCVGGAFAFIYTNAINEPGRKVLYYFGIGFAVVSLLLLQEQMFGGHGLMEWSFEQLHLNYERFLRKNVNRGLCALVVMVWPLMLGLYLKGKQRDAWMLMGLFALAVFSLHSLSAKLGLVVGVGTFLALRRYPVWTSRAILVAIPLFFITFPFFYMLTESTLFADPFVRSHLPESALHRLSIWHGLLEKTWEKPWLGWGMNTTRAMPLSPEALAGMHLEGPPLHPHSPSIQILLEQGFTGFLLSATAFALLLREWVRMPLAKEIQRATAGALIVAYFAAGISSFGIWQHWWIATLWISAMLWRWMGREHTPVSA